MKGFKAAENFGPPNETQMKSLLEGAKAQPLEGGRFLLTDISLQTFSTNGSRELVIKAPQCLYDSAAKSASSPSSLLVQTADGKFLIEGEGFLFLQTNSSLVISNQVHTLLHPDMLNTATNAAGTKSDRAQSSPVEILSDRFQYTGEPGAGVYEGHVRASGTNQMGLTSQRLAFQLPFRERQLREILAEHNVTLDYSGVHATGQSALYSAATGLMKMSGQPAWRSELREGRGDDLTIDPTNKIFRADGHAWVKLPAQSLSIASLLSPSNAVPADAQSSTNHFVEIASAYHEFRTNQAVFGENVRVIEYATNQARGTMSCGLMTATFAASNQLDTLEAQNQVVMNDGTNTLSGGHTRFTGSNGVLTVTEAPAWSSGLRNGKGEIIEVNTRTNEMLVRGHASMRLPARELARAADPKSVAGSPAANDAAAGETAEILCEEYVMRPQGAQFRGGVRAVHPHMNLDCGTLDVLLPAAGGQIESIHAERGVTFDLLDEKGRKVHGTGERAVYSYKATPSLTNDLLELTGSPAVLVNTNGTTRSGLIIWDRNAQTIRTSGAYEISGQVQGVGTNALVLPKPKLAK